MSTIKAIAHLSVRAAGAGYTRRVGGENRNAIDLKYNYFYQREKRI
jgi:hypothetical protein